MVFLSFPNYNNGVKQVAVSEMASVFQDEKRENCFRQTQSFFKRPIYAIHMLRNGANFDRYR